MVLDQLPIQLENLQECEIARALQNYACDLPGMGQHISHKATHLLQRWQVSVYNLSYEYDEEGLHEIKQRELKRKLEVLTDLNPKKFKKDNQEQGQISKDDELIRKAKNGNFQMYKSNFDFLEKPQPSFELTLEEFNKHKKQKSARSQISQAFMAQKKQAKLQSLN